MSQAPTTVDPVTKKIKLVRYWTFGVFVLAIAAVTTMIGLFTGNVGQIIGSAWPMWLLIFIACAVVFFGYPWWARRGQ